MILKKILENTKFNVYFNAIEFILFILGVYLGYTQNKIYMITSIILVGFIFIIKILLEIYYENQSEISHLKNQISTLIINKNESIIMYAPYVKRNKEKSEVTLTVFSQNKNILSPKLRIEYSGDVSSAQLLNSKSYEAVNGNSSHMVLREEDSFEFFPEENLSVETISARRIENDKYFQFHFVIETRYMNSIKYSLIDNTGKYISDIHLNHY